MVEFLLALIGAGIIALVLILRFYVPGYITKKGENLATKEDIADITHRLERVRTEYAAQIEELRISLQRNLQNQQRFATERDRALLAFYDTGVDLMYDGLAVNFGDFPTDGGRALFEHARRFEKGIGGLLRRYQRLVLYFDHDDELRAAAEQVVLHGLNALKVHKKHYASIKITALEEDAAFKSGERSRMNKAVEASNDANGKYWSAMKVDADGYQTSIRRYLTLLNGHLRPKDQARNASEFFGADSG